MTRTKDGPRQVAPVPFVQWPAPVVPPSSGPSTEQLMVTIAMPTAVDVWDVARWPAVTEATMDGTGLRLPGTAGNYAATPDSSALDVTGDIEIVVRAAATDWTLAATQMLLAKRQTVSTRSYRMYVFGGYIYFQISTNGSDSVIANSSAAVPFSAGQAGWVRVTRDATTGSVTFYTAADSSSEPGSWTQLGTTQSTTPSNIYSSNSQLEIGSNLNGGSPLTGTIYRAIVRSGIGGTAVFDANFAAQAAGTTTFQESAHRADVTVHRRTPPTPVHVPRWDATDIGNMWNVTCDVEGLQITWGRDSTTGHVRPAEAVIALANHGGQYLPWADGPQRRRLWWLGAPVQVRTGTGPVFTGYVDELSETDDADDWPVVALRCTGVSGYLASMDGVEQGAQGVGERAGARLHRICNHAILPQWVQRRFDQGTVPLQATTMARGALEECWLVADSDGGAVFDTPDGDLVFLDAHTMTNARRYTEPQATFTDDPHAGLGAVVPLTSMTVKLDASPTVDSVGIACAGGTVQTAERHTSLWRAKKTWSRTDLVHQGDDHSSFLARLILDRLANRVLNVEPMEFDTLDSEAGWTVAHHLAPYDRVRVRRRRHGHVLDLSATVDQITHRITPDSWTTTVTVSPGVQKTDFARWDEARWDLVEWA